MKKTTDQNLNQPKKLDNKEHRPENKDNLDSREGEEQLTKGDDVTHNKKEIKSAKTTTKNAHNS